MNFPPQQPKGINSFRSNRLSASCKSKKTSRPKPFCSATDLAASVHLPSSSAFFKILLTNLGEVVTLASILEREVRVREELPLVSAVYHNRLKKHMMMQADPTVQFAQGLWKSRLTYDDYRNTRSPYNTYLNFGLPPGPICSPGTEAIQAALYPAASNALYFLAAEGGRHTFSADYRTHVNKVNHRNRGKRS